MNTDAIRCPEAIATLEHIGSKPGTTHRDLLTITRRIVRHHYELRHIIYTERQVMTRQARILRQSGLFTQRRAIALEQQAEHHREDELEHACEALVAYGRALAYDCEGYNDELDMEELACLLNINRVDCEHARRMGWTRLYDLAIEGMENGSGRYEGGVEYSRSPLLAALMLWGWFRHQYSPDQLPEPRTVRPVRKRRTLVVHDASGSRVVER